MAANQSVGGSQVPVMAAPEVYYPQGSGGAGTVIIVSCYYRSTIAEHVRAY